MFSASGLGPVCLNDKVNSNVYQNLLQLHAVLPLGASPTQPADFMQDNATPHSAKRIKKFLDDERIEILK